MSVPHASFIKSLPLLDCRGVDVAIEIVPMNRGHIAQWRRNVQPIIDNCYRRAGHGDRRAQVRADVRWNWRLIHVLAGMHNWAASVSGGTHTPAVALTLLIRARNGEKVPAGMLTTVPAFHSTVEGVTRARSLVWYLAAAPAEFYRVAGIARVAGVSKALLDAAIQCGLAAGSDGSLLLHADPNGGSGLQEFYLKKCNMVRLSSNSPPISMLRRRSTNQYFVLASADAIAFSRQFDNRR